jgi:uncharacterized membrane protein
MHRTHRFHKDLFARVLVCCWALLGGCEKSSQNGPGDSGSPMDLAASCTVTAPTTCPFPVPRYADVQPIFQQRCVTCHSGQTERWPLTMYQHVADWYDVVRDQVLTCMMPPPDSGIPMTNQERVAILAWIRCGFPE